MKITDISVQVIDAGKTMIFADRLIMNLANVVVRVKTDEVSRAWRARRPTWAQPAWPRQSPR